MKNYTTKQRIENYLLISIDENFDGQVESWIEAVETYIDRYTRRDFADPEQFDAIPEDIKYAATILVSGIINYSLNSDGEVASMTVGRYSVSFKNDKQFNDKEQAIEILNSYKLFTF